MMSKIWVMIAGSGIGTLTGWEDLRASRAITDCSLLTTKMSSMPHDGSACAATEGRVRYSGVR